VLIQGTGGVSLFALQFAKTFGARVLAITSFNEKAAKLKGLGADAVVNYSITPNWDQEIISLTSGTGVDKVLDIAGEKTIVKSIASTKISGTVVLIGFASGFGGGLPPIDVLTRTLTVTGSMLVRGSSSKLCYRRWKGTKSNPSLIRSIPSQHSARHITELRVDSKLAKSLSRSRNSRLRRMLERLLKKARLGKVTCLVA
jgi:NADPH:quinone reductase-like Zn-dependent oxidoreductase